MKKWISGTVVLVVVILLGGWLYVDHANKETTYRTNLAKGNTALKEQNYAQAKRDFQVSLTAKPDSKKANGLVSQVEKFMDGEDELKSNDFSTAKSSFKMAANDENGSTDLANQAEQKVKLVSSVMDNIKRFNKIYKTAVEQHNDKKYALSNETLNQILQDRKIKQSYYADVLAKAKDLKKSNEKALNNQTQPAATNNDNNVTDNTTKKKAATKNDSDEAMATAIATQQAQAAALTTNPASPNISGLNVYTNPQEYANRFANSGASSNTSNVDNTNIANGPVSNDSYNVYTNPAQYANRFN